MYATKTLEICAPKPGQQNVELSYTSAREQLGGAAGISPQVALKILAIWACFCVFTGVTHSAEGNLGRIDEGPPMLLPIDKYGIM